MVAFEDILRDSSLWEEPDDIREVCTRAGPEKVIAVVASLAVSRVPNYATALAFASRAAHDVPEMSAFLEKDTVLTAAFADLLASASVRDRRAATLYVELLPVDVWKRLLAAAAEPLLADRDLITLSHVLSRVGALDVGERLLHGDDWLVRWSLLPWTNASTSEDAARMRKQLASDPHPLVAAEATQHLAVLAKIEKSLARRRDGWTFYSPMNHGPALSFGEVAERFFVSWPDEKTRYTLDELRDFVAIHRASTPWSRRGRQWWQWVRARVWVAAVLTVGMGCRARPPEPSVASPAARVENQDAGVASSAAWPRAVEWRFGELGGAWCAYADEGAFCLYPDYPRAGAEPHAPWKPHLIEGSAHVAELTARARCLLDSHGVVGCKDQPSARSVKSIAGFPYLLHEDGSVEVAAADGVTPETAKRARDEAAARRRIVKDLPPLERIVSGNEAACAITKTGAVMCWVEPRFHFEEEALVINPPVAVPGLPGRAVGLFLQPWMTLCAQLADGSVFCSAPTPIATEACVLRGNTSVRCGKQPVAKEGRMADSKVAGEGYDPRRLLTRALTRVPGVDDAVTMAAFESREKSAMPTRFQCRSSDQTLMNLKPSPSSISHFTVLPLV